MDKLFDYKNAGKYAYSVAKIRAYETRLLTREKILRMLGAEDASECFRMLEEAGYPVAQGSLYDFTSILKKEYSKALDVLKELSMDERVYNLFAVRHDFHNLRVAVKEFYSREDLKSAYQTGGIFSRKEIKAAVFDEDFSKLGEDGKVLGAAFGGMKKAYGDTSSPKMIDIVADRFMYGEIRKRAGRIGNSFLTRIFVKEIDLINTRTFFRLRYLQKKRSDFTEAYIDGGDLHIDFFLKNYDDDFYTLKNLFKGTEFLPLITEGSTYLEEKKSFLRFERLISEYYMKYVKSARWISFGIEPIIAYHYAKQKEIKAVSMILTGKLNELPYDDIKEGIPDEYL